MIETNSLMIGLGGFLLGAVLAGLWTATHLWTRFQTRLVEAAERTQRAEGENTELRKQFQEERAELTRIRQALSEAQRAQTVAETRAEDTLRNVREQRALLAESRQELAETFKALSGEALKTNNEAFLNLAKTSFETLHAEAKGDLLQRHQAIDDLVKPLYDVLNRYDEQLRLMESSRQAAYGGLDQHLKQLTDLQQRLQQETGNLVKALRAPSVRGRWGELTLKRVAELAGMVGHCDFVEQEGVETEEGRLRPDMINRLPRGRQIDVDAKAVLSAYLDAHEATDELQRQDRLRRHAAQVRARMDQLSGKAYWNQFDQTPEIVVLFLPGEHFLEAALAQDSALIEDGYARRVVLATPNTLIALLHAAAYGWRQDQLSESVQQAGQLGKDLYERMAVLAEHLDAVGQALGKSVQAFNKAVGSLETRIFPAARKFKELGVASDKGLPVVEQIETAPRTVPPVNDMG